MSKKIYSFKGSYKSNTVASSNTKVIMYYFVVFFQKFFYFLLIILSIFMIRLNTRNIKMVGNIKRNVLYLSKPIFVISETPFNLVFDFINTVKKIILINKNNKKLIEENILLKKMYIQSRDIKAENDNLKKMLNFVDEIDNDYDYVTSRVYNVTKNGMTNVLTLNVGSNNGIEEGDLVLGVNRSVVGRVVNVMDNYSDVLLLNDINSKIPARTVSTNEKIILSGDNNGHLIISYFNSKVPEIIDGDYVFTSGDSNIIPDGFLIGYVKKNKEGIIIEMTENTQILFNVMVITQKHVNTKNTF